MDTSSDSDGEVLVADDGSESDNDDNIKTGVVSSGVVIKKQKFDFSDDSD